MEDVGIFYGHLVHFTVFWYILLTFGIFCGNLLYFSRFGILYREKSGNPDMYKSRSVGSLCFPAQEPILGTIVSYKAGGVKFYNSTSSLFCAF
jgi:hypothetical protein